jgi:hypothetical protein
MQVNGSTADGSRRMGSTGARAPSLRAPTPVFFSPPSDPWVAHAASVANRASSSFRLADGYSHGDLDKIIADMFSGKRGGSAAREILPEDQVQHLPLFPFLPTHVRQGAQESSSFLRAATCTRTPRAQCEMILGREVRGEVSVWTLRWMTCGEGGRIKGGSGSGTALENLAAKDSKSCEQADTAARRWRRTLWSGQLKTRNSAWGLSDERFLRKSPLCCAKNVLDAPFTAPCFVH